MKNILILGGTGTWGKALLWKLLKDDLAEKIVVFSRDELKQSQVLHSATIHFPSKVGRLQFILGDIRNPESILDAMGAEVIVDLAALKQVPGCEANPWEAIQTNVIGTRNALRAAFVSGIKKFLFVSSDKACAPFNLYGKTKAVAESLVTTTGYSCLRSGNALGSRGSVLELWRHQQESGDPLSITDKRMTRFFFSVQEAIQFILFSLDRIEGGEIFVPKMRSIALIDLAQAMFPMAPIQEIGVRPGEKLHESLIADTELEQAYLDEGRFYKIRRNKVEHHLQTPIRSDTSLFRRDPSSWVEAMLMTSKETL